MNFDTTNTPEEFVKAPNSKEHIDTKLPSYHMLEGEYRSFLLGKSEDYEDLKEYQVGDSVRDIDWRATARMREPVIRRFRQEKKHDVLFLIDSGRNMLGAAPSYETKQRLALQTAGALMNIVLQHQDTVKVSYVSNNQVLSPNATTSSSTLNSVLNNINMMPYDSRSSDSSAAQLLNHAQRSLKRSSIVVVVSDTYTVMSAEKELSLLSHKHHILWISMEDCLVANFDTQREYADIQSSDIFPSQIRTDPKVVEALKSSLEEYNHKISQLLSSVKSNHVSISGEDMIVPSLYSLLHESSLEKG